MKKDESSVSSWSEGMVGRVCGGGQHTNVDELAEEGVIGAIAVCTE